MDYLHRTADVSLGDLLDAFGAVLIEGPKWCGKTTTAEQHAATVVRMQDPDRQQEYMATASTKPSLLLQGKTPVLIDEWQDAPVLWDAVRTMVDQRGEPGQFILTGSNSVPREETRHSGTGRIARLRMLPMSLWESGESTGDVSLKEVFDNPDFRVDGGVSRMEVEDLIFSACRGGWPATLQGKTDKAKLLVAQNYVGSVCAEDVSRIDKRQRNERLAALILRSYARNISTLVKKTVLLQDIAASGNNITDATLDDYLDVLERLFVIQDVDAWSPAIRSRTAIRSMPKRSFCDPSIAVAALGLSPVALEKQLKTFGFIFEQMCIRDLRSYTVEMGGHVSYYRDRYGLEVDVVLHLADGRYALVECKLGASGIEEGAKHLLEIKHLIQEKNKTEQQVPIREPDVLMVLTGGQFAYTRADGILVVPIGCLRP